MSILQKKSFYPDILYEIFCFLTRVQLSSMERASYKLHKLVRRHFSSIPYYLIGEIEFTNVCI